jgi:hypothetical protein
MLPSKEKVCAQVGERKSQVFTLVLMPVTLRMNPASGIAEGCYFKVEEGY